MFRSWSEPDRLLALALQEYEDDLCSGCGWPMTYTMHKDAGSHWSSPDRGVRCHGCAAREDAQQRVERTKDARHAGLRFPVRPDKGMWHAMSDPILTYPDDSQRIGASGLDYSPIAELSE